MNKNIDENTMDDEELFHQTYYYFIQEIDALSKPAEITCEIQGNYNVAYEFWQGLPLDPTLLLNKPQILSADQLEAIKKLFHDIKALPEEAYQWTTIVEESIQNMKHPAWTPIRQQAKELLLMLKLVTKLNNEYYDQ